MQLLNLERTQFVNGGDGGVYNSWSGGSFNTSERASLNYIWGQYQSQPAGSEARYEWMDTYIEAYWAFKAN